jgi:hypothetical protein
MQPDNEKKFRHDTNIALRQSQNVLSLLGALPTQILVTVPEQMSIVSVRIESLEDPRVSSLLSEENCTELYSLARFVTEFESDAKSALTSIVGKLKSGTGRAISIINHHLWLYDDSTDGGSFGPIASDDDSDSDDEDNRQRGSFGHKNDLLFALLNYAKRINRNNKLIILNSIKLSRNYPIDEFMDFTSVKSPAEPPVIIQGQVLSAGDVVCISGQGKSTLLSALPGDWVNGDDLIHCELGETSRIIFEKFNGNDKIIKFDNFDLIYKSNGKIISELIEEISNNFGLIFIYSISSPIIEIPQQIRNKTTKFFTL